MADIQYASIVMSRFNTFNSLGVLHSSEREMRCQTDSDRYDTGSDYRL